jgi:hypothetical protein
LVVKIRARRATPLHGPPDAEPIANRTPAIVMPALGRRRDQRSNVDNANAMATSGRGSEGDVDGDHEHWRLRAADFVNTCTARILSVHGRHRAPSPERWERGCRRIPEATVARLPIYLRILTELARTVSTAPSDRLAELGG